MQTNHMNKIIIISVGVMAFIAIGLLSWYIFKPVDGRESGYTSGRDTISGVEYSTTITGGERGTTLSVLGLTNLRDEGVSAGDVEIIRQYISYLAINHFDKTLDDIVSISEKNISFTVGDNATNTTYSFHVYINPDTPVIGKLVTPLKNETSTPKTLSFYTLEGELIEKYDV